MPTAVEITRELEAFYKDYIDTFNREDVDAFLEKWSYPFAWVSGDGGLTVTASKGDNQRGVGQIFAGIKRRGWARSVTDRMTAWPLAENLGMILADVTRYKSDGSVLERVRACYTLRRNGQSWQIVTVSEVKPPFLGPGDIAR